LPIAFVAIGALFLIAAVRGTVVDKGSAPGLLTLLKGDFTGQNNFLIWMVAIWALGALGYIPGFKPIANAFLVLFLVVLFLSNKGFFAQFQSALQTTTTANVSQPSSLASGTP
jgi:hypothetical protein